MKIIIEKFLVLFRKVSPSMWVIFILQLIFIPFLHQSWTSNYSVFIFCLMLIKTLLNLGIAFFLITILFRKWKKIYSMISIFLIYFYTILLLYHYHSGGSLDFLLLWNFRHDLLAGDVWDMISNYIGINTIIFLILLLLGLIISQIRWQLFSYRKASKRPFWNYIIFLIVLVIINTIPIHSFDEVTPISKTIQSLYRIQTVFSQHNYENIKEFPYIKSLNITASKVDQSKLPNIFIIAIESFNANFAERKTNAGKEIMPFFDSLISKGVYVEHFYGNSVLTDKGHMAILFSILPSFRNSVFGDFSSDNFQSLAQILDNFGYKTIFFQGGNTKALKFGNEGPFLSKNGFQICKGTDGISIKDMASYNFKDPYNKSGFGGFKDYVLYNQFFKTLDSLHNSSKSGESKFFALLATISSHSPWLRETGNQELPYPHSNKVEEDYANEFFHVDSYLRIFVNELNERKYLDNSIIIITGDHSQPVNEHGNIARAVGAYQENFRIPLLMIWKNVLKPERIDSDEAWSQMDIAPTLLDLLNIKVTNHFLGHSFLDKNFKNNFVYLVQPVDGVYVCVVNYPYKYSFHVSTKDEFLYNLKEDPQEKNNLVDNVMELDTLNYLRKKVQAFGLNEYLLEHDRIWYGKLKLRISNK